MTQRWMLLVLAAALTIGASTAALAQGVQTGTIRGTIKDQQDLAVPGVTVTATSAVLQGQRISMTDMRGAYAFVALPPGDYALEIELSGFEGVHRNTTAVLGLAVEENVTLRVAGRSETVQVVAQAGPPIASATVGANFRRLDIERLATPRTLQGIAQLSVGVTENAPDKNQLVINGAMAYDNVFMVNGVDVNDNLFAQPQNLFVEDAIDETQVLTSGISAEYGRFGGGVINAITKSGGNAFSGSARVNFLNSSWTTETPFEASNSVKHPSDLQQTFEGTFGGPLVKDRLWFFSSGRYASVDNAITLPRTGAQRTQKDKNTRGELKLTATVAPGHTVQGGFMNDPRSVSNHSGVLAYVIDPNSLGQVDYSNWYYYGNYRGVVRENLLVEGQYSERRYELKWGGSGKAITSSPFVGTGFDTIYNAPYFDASDPEQRNNRQAAASATSFWNRAGRHDTKAGYEFYRSQRKGGGSQSPTLYAFGVDFLTDVNGAPVVDGTGRPIPNFVPGVSYVEYTPAVRGAVLNNDAHSLYVQDHWTPGAHWSTDFGARYEYVTAKSTGGVQSISAGRIVPRLAAAYDVRSDGRHVVRATYGQYSGRYNEALIGRNSPVANAPYADAAYTGPAGSGYGFAAGFDVANYPINAANAAVVDPRQNVFVKDGTKSPLTHEFTASYGATLWGGRAHSEVTYVARTTHGLIEDFQTVAGGTTNVVVSGVSAGTFTNQIYQNTDLAHREYHGLVFQSRYRIANNWDVNGHYTLQLKNDGNYEGEGTNAPGKMSFIGNYPEAFTASRNFPDGRLQNFQRSRVRIWSTYNLNLERRGDVSFSGLWRIDSGRAYSLVAEGQSRTATQNALLAAAGYPDRPANSGNMVFFNGERGSETFKGYALFDVSINYNVPVLRSVRPWVKVDVFNLFDNQKLIAWNTKVTQDAASPKDSLGLATGYLKDANFGKATGNTVTNLGTTINAYPLAFNGATPGGRTFRIAVGLTF